MEPSRRKHEDTLKNSETMRGLNWAEAFPFFLSLSLFPSFEGFMEFYSPWKENKVYTPLGLETIKVSGIDLKRRCCPEDGATIGEKETKTE